MADGSSGADVDKGLACCLIEPSEFLKHLQWPSTQLAFHGEMEAVWCFSFPIFPDSSTRLPLEAVV